MSIPATADSPVAGSSRQIVSRTALESFFADINQRMELVDRPELEHFFAAVSHRMEQQHHIDKKKATDFNVFDLIEPDENKLSDVLAILLNPNGDHGQGDLFLRLLFKQLSFGSDAKLSKGAVVHREAPTHGVEKYRRRVDVFVEAGALVAIENKVDSLDQTDQVKDYLNHVRYCTRGSNKKSALIYLTPNGRRPKSHEHALVNEAMACGKLHCWSYQVELRKWLEDCRRECEARRICDFISDFIAYIELALQREPEINQEDETDEK